MQAQVGDRLRIHGRTVGSHDQEGEIIEVRGADGGPPYLVRYSDGTEHLTYPGPDAEVKRKNGS